MVTTEDPRMQRPQGLDDRFTERARKVLTLAQDEAKRFNHNYIGTEHLLLGLVREGDGVAARVLESLEVKLPRVRSAVEFIIGRGETQVEGEIGLTPRAKKCIELAVDEARRLDHHYIGTEHLLLGIVREGEGIAAGVLESLGVNLEKVRAHVMHVIGIRPLPIPDRAPTEEDIDGISDSLAAMTDLEHVLGLTGLYPTTDIILTQVQRVKPELRNIVMRPNVLQGFEKIMDGSGLVYHEMWKDCPPFAAMSDMCDRKSPSKHVGECPRCSMVYHALVIARRDQLDKNATEARAQAQAEARQAIIAAPSTGNTRNTPEATVIVVRP